MTREAGGGRPGTSAGHHAGLLVLAVLVLAVLVAVHPQVLAIVLLVLCPPSPWSHRGAREPPLPGTEDTCPGPTAEPPPRAVLPPSPPSSPLCPAAHQGPCPSLHVPWPCLLTRGHLGSVLTEDTSCRGRPLTAAANPHPRDGLPILLERKLRLGEEREPQTLQFREAGAGGRGETLGLGLGGWGTRGSPGQSLAPFLWPLDPASVPFSP